MSGHLELPPPKPNSLSKASQLSSNSTSSIMDLENFTALNPLLPIEYVQDKIQANNKQLHVTDSIDQKYSQFFRIQFFSHFLELL